VYQGQAGRSPSCARRSRRSRTRPSAAPGSPDTTAGKKSVLALSLGAVAAGV